MTKKESLNKLMEVVTLSADIFEAEREDLKNFIKNELELLDKRLSSKNRKNEESNKVLYDAIAEVLADMDKPMTLNELVIDSRLATYEKVTKAGVVTETMTTQRLASLLAKMREAGTIVKTIEKKKAYYSLVKKEKETE